MPWHARHAAGQALQTDRPLLLKTWPASPGLAHRFIRQAPIPGGGTPITVSQFDSREMTVPKRLHLLTSSRMTDIVLLLIPLLLIPWTHKNESGTVDALFRLLGNEEVGHGVVAASILLVETKYIVQNLLSRFCSANNDSRSEPSRRGAGLDDHRQKALGEKSIIDAVLAIVTGFFVGALGGLGGAFIGALAAVLILLHT